MDDRPAEEYPRDANARIFRRFAWNPLVVHHWPPNRGAHSPWWLFATRTDREWTDDWTQDREITLQ